MTHVPQEVVDKIKQLTLDFMCNKLPQEPEMAKIDHIDLQRAKSFAHKPIILNWLRVKYRGAKKARDWAFQFWQESPCETTEGCAKYWQHGVSFLKALTFSLDPSFDLESE